jgi:hypothetical protein
MAVPGTKRRQENLISACWDPLGVIVTDYVGFSVLYRLIQAWQSRRFAKECQALVGTYNVNDAVARKLVRYWGDWLGR